MSFKEELQHKKRELLAYLVVTGIFMTVNFGAGLYLFLKPPDARLFEVKLPSKTAGIGPIEVEKDNSIYTVVVKAELTTGHGYSYTPKVWNFIEGELLDSNKEFLMGFGQELWKEVDAYGTYSNTEYELPLVIAEKGTYYLFFSQTGGAPETLKSITIEVLSLRGNSFPNFMMGGVSLFVVFSLWLRLIWLTPESREKFQKRINTITVIFLTIVFTAIVLWAEYYL